ncbi:hypothetical protein [Geobacter sp.]|nr:hypothetical protein [Geobacter sp.]
MAAKNLSVFLDSSVIDFGHIRDGEFPFSILTPARFLDHCRMFLAGE